MGVGDQPAEVLVALPGLGQQQQVEGLRIRLALLVAHASTGDVCLHADDRLDLARGAGLRERDRAVQSPVVRDGHGVEPELRPSLGQLVDPPQPVEQAELGVEMQMDEVVRRNGHGA
jgi:hypothetical protein